jgi:hypothetical protein
MLSTPWKWRRIAGSKRPCVSAMTPMRIVREGLTGL